MALSGKLVSIKDLIWSVYRDNAIQDELSYNDLIEWSIECLELIYHPDQFQRKITGHVDNPDLDITNYKVKIPCDLVHLVAVRVDGFPALPSTNSFHQLMDGSCCGTEEFASELSNGTFVDGFGNTFVTNLGTSSNSTPLTYELNNDWLTLSVKTGEVCLAYLAHPTDCDGFPMIPDNVSYKRAITTYLTMKLDYIKWRQSPSDQGLRNLYDHSEQQYNWYVGQAQNAAKLPDINKMESLKNQMVRLKPMMNQWSSSFANLSVPELRRLR